MSDTIINSLTRKIGALQASVGLKTISKNFDLQPQRVTLSLILDAFNKLGIQGTQLDSNYYSTSWENWQIILDSVWNIIKNFNWVADKFDCDNRSSMVADLCGLLFGVNTCCQVYCNVTDPITGNEKYLHWTNIIVDLNGNTYLFDVDNGGLKQKITSPNVVMGNCNYKLISYRIG